MATAADLRAEAQHLCTLARNTTDPRVIAEIKALIAELERRAREMGHGNGTG
jgi:hypothetical protein